MANKVNLRIVKREGETLDQMLRRYKNAFIAEGLADDIRKQEYYRSPSQKEREKREKAARQRWVDEQKAKRYRRDVD